MANEQSFGRWLKIYFALSLASLIFIFVLAARLWLFGPNGNVSFTILSWQGISIILSLVLFTVIQGVFLITLKCPFCATPVIKLFSNGIFKLFLFHHCPKCGNKIQ